MITAVIPKLPFVDKNKTLDFYCNQLDFLLISDYGDYLILNSNEIELHFFSYPTLIKEKSDFMIYLRIDSDIEKFYEEIQNKSVAIHPNGKLQNKSWHLKEFSIIDPSGTLLTFGQLI